jgi:hypothetical protein
VIASVILGGLHPAAQAQLNPGDILVIDYNAATNIQGAVPCDPGHRHPPSPPMYRLTSDQPPRSLCWTVLIPDNFNYTTDGSFGGPRLGQITVEAVGQADQPAAQWRG